MYLMLEEKEISKVLEGLFTIMEEFNYQLNDLDEYSALYKANKNKRDEILNIMEKIKVQIDTNKNFKGDE